MGKKIFLGRPRHTLVINITVEVKGLGHEDVIELKWLKSDGDQPSGFIMIKIFLF
jgi:hypothetical protein